VWKNRVAAPVVNILVASNNGRQHWSMNPQALMATQATTTMVDQKRKKGGTRVNYHLVSMTILFGFQNCNALCARKWSKLLR